MRFLGYFMIVASIVSRTMGDRYMIKTKEMEWKSMDSNSSQIQHLLDSENIIDAEEDMLIYATAEWNLDRLDQVSLPLSNTYSPKYRGVGYAYIFDTGIYSEHELFGDRVESGMNFVDPNLPPTDVHGHGTHVAGTVGADIYGVSDKVSLVPMKVLNDKGWGYGSYLVNGVNWAISDYKKRPTKCGVISMSIGGGFNKATNDIVNKARDAGLIVVVAAGNERDNACNHSPASASDVISVGSTTASDKMSWFSNYGECVHIFAPGSDVRSLSTSNSGTRVMSGTSMATPHVTGVVMQLYEKYGCDDKDLIEDKLLDYATSGGDLNILQVPDVGEPQPSTPRPTPRPTSPTQSPTPGTDKFVIRNGKGWGPKWLQGRHMLKIRPINVKSGYNFILTFDNLRINMKEGMIRVRRGPVNKKAGLELVEDKDTLLEFKFEHGSLRLLQDGNELIKIPNTEEPRFVKMKVRKLKLECELSY